jgi:hypothetical protein
LLQQGLPPSKVDVSSSKRQRVIELILTLARKLKQRQKTVHFAIVYADILMENGNVFTSTYADKTQFNKAGGSSKMVMDEYLMGATCVLLASKFYEIDDNLIMISDLQKEMKQLCYIRDEEVQRTEIQILNRMNWNLLRTLPLDFVQHFIQMGFI